MLRKSLNSPCRGFVTRWNGGACPPAWNGTWLPIGVLWGANLGSLAARMAFGRLRGPWLQELKPSSFCGLPSGGLWEC